MRPLGHTRLVTEYVDAAQFEKDYGQTLSWLRGSDPDGNAIFGMPTSLTINGAYVNKTLFEQAGVPLPEEGATWDDWAAATQKVAEATDTDFPMEMDRSGHRFASFAISQGAELVDDQGRPVVDDGLRNAIEKFKNWHETGVMPMDLWGAVGGATHRELFADFLNANVVFYFGGSWNLGKMDAEVGDLFDEPLSNLDAELRVHMRLEITKLHERLGNTMIYVTHDQIEAMTMADKIVVLRRGVIEQVGAPLELYNTPRNTFVAGQKVTLGIRPEHLVTDEEHALTWPVTVSVSEQHGANTYLHCTLPDGTPVLIHEPGQSALARGDVVDVRPRESHWHLFDETGQRIDLE